MTNAVASSTAGSTARKERIANVLRTLAASAWAGGLAIVGAVVAPTVFAIVPAPASADAMTTVFARLDRVAMVCILVLVASEVITLRTRPTQRADIVRGVALFVASAAALFVALVASPRIVALHVAGAIRRVGESGAALDYWHGWAERVSKLELLALIVLLAATGWGAPRRDEPGRAAPVSDDAGAQEST